MNPTMLSGRLPFLAFILAMSLGAAFGDGDEAEEEGDKAEVTIDTCGRLSGRRVTFSTSNRHSHGRRGMEIYESEFSIDMEVLTRNGKVLDTSSTALLSWAATTYSDGTEPPTGPVVKAWKDSLRLSDGENLLAEFAYRKDELTMARGFRKWVIRELENDSTKFWAGGLLEILAGASWPDKHFLQVLQLYGIRDSIRQGYTDAMIASLEDLTRDPADDTIARYGKRLSDSLSASKRDDQPLKLLGAKKVGTIMNDPVYPPLDSPTVFWQDSLLAVVQEEAAKPRLMRVFNPATGKWGRTSPVKYPETALSKMYQRETGYADGNGGTEYVCWRDRLGNPKDDGVGLDCSPLIQLDDSIDGGSIRNFSDLAKAGGSCAAGWGQYEFRDGGALFNRLDGNGTDYKVRWELFPGSLLSGTRKYGFELARDYPVVVSPYQDWIAYAMDSKDGKSKELWVARLKYRQ